MQLKLLCVMNAPRQGAIADPDTGAISSGTVHDLRFQGTFNALNRSALGQAQPFHIDIPGVRASVAAAFVLGEEYFLDIDAVL